MTSGIFGSGISGLQAAQRALSVTSHNISNVNTEGYSRQRVEQGARPPQLLGGQFIGTGVTVNSIERIYEEFNSLQLRSTTSGHSQAEQFHSLASRINNLLADTNAGVMPAMQSFFDAVQGVSNDPASQVSRQVMISEANNLTGRIRDFDQQLDAIRTDTNSLLTAAVDDVNSLTASIAGLNSRIIESGSNNGPPNDLLDQRDQLIRDLSELTSVTTVAQEDGSLNVFIGNGQAVVAGVESRPLSLVPGVHDSGRLEVAFDVEPNPIVITGQLSGGRIGGVVEFRNTVLDPAQNSLGQLAVGIASSFNEQHAMGMNLNGSLGGDFFLPSAPAAEVLAGAGNSGLPAASIEATITDAGALTASDYRLERSGSNYTLTRLNDNQTFSLNGFPGTDQTVDGITLSLDSGTIADGDSFLIRPTRNAAKNFGVAISDSSLIAAAGPLRSSATLANTGNGSIEGLALDDRDAFTGLGYTLTATSGSGSGAADSYSVVDSNGVVVAGGALPAGAPIEFDGISFSLAGTPEHGDEFTISPNINGVSDNRNALALSGLQSTNTLNNGSASYQSLYGRLVADVGNQTRQAELNVDVQNGLLNRAIESRDATSGVNLDEEAANLLRFQQAYQASAQVITTANNMFQTLISIVQR